MNYFRTLLEKKIPKNNFELKTYLSKISKNTKEF